MSTHTCRKTSQGGAGRKNSSRPAGKLVEVGDSGSLSQRHDERRLAKAVDLAPRRLRLRRSGTTPMTPRTTVSEFRQIACVPRKGCGRLGSSKRYITEQDADPMRLIWTKPAEQILAN